MAAWLTRHRTELAARAGSDARASIEAEAARLLGTAPSDADYAREIEAVRRDAEMGRAIGITGVPTLCITRTAAGWRAEHIDLAVELELARR
jgi:hypothetical protein